MPAPLTDKLRVNIFSMFLALVSLIAVAGYGTVALTSHDLGWFQKGFSQWPNRVVVYHDGTHTEYLPGQAGYNELAEAVRLSLASGAVRPSAIGLSTGSLQDAFNLYVSVEAFFPTPVKLHAWFNTDSPTQILFLITGRHSEQPIIFLGVDTIGYMSNGPILSTVEPLRTTLQNLGYTLQ